MTSRPDPEQMSREQLEAAVRVLRRASQPDFSPAPVPPETAPAAPEKMSATKAHAAGGASAAVAIIITYVLRSYAPDMPPDVQAAIVALLVGGVGWAAAYLATNKVLS